jgi:hypothetical protein
MEGSPSRAGGVYSLRHHSSHGGGWVGSTCCPCFDACSSSSDRCEHRGRIGALLKVKWRVPHRKPSGRHQDTATGPPPLSERVTITLPVHPLKGVELPVARFLRSQDGRRYVDVEHPAGQYMRLPLEWTDRAPPLVPPSVEGRAARLCVPALLELASAVQVALSGHQSSSAAPLADGGPTLRHAAVSIPEDRPAMGSPAPGSKTATAQQVGHPAAQGALRPRRGRGGKP